MPIVWQMPDGSIQITRLVQAPDPTSGESVSDAVLRLARIVQAKTPALVGGIPTLVPTAQIPPDRLNRTKWRLQGTSVVPDLSIPDPPHPRQALINEIAAATTIADLKLLLRKVVE